MDIGALRHLITLEGPGTKVSDGDSGYSYLYDDPLEPSQVWASIVPATAKDLERVAAGTVMSTASHIVTMRHHGGVNTQTRITFGARHFSVTGVMNPEERNITTICLCVELVA